MKMIWKFVVATVVAVGTLIVAADLATAPSVPSFQQTVHTATLSTVRVERDDGGHGAGVVVKAGLVVTARHVVEGKTEVVLRFNDGLTVKANVIGMDDDEDMAILSFGTSRPESVSALRCDLPPQRGEFIFTVGHPFALNWVSTFGYVAGYYTDDGLGTKLPGLGFVLSNLNAWFGNSGGGVFDKNGQVVGIMTNLIAPTWPDNPNERHIILTMFVPAKVACDLIAKHGV